MLIQQSKPDQRPVPHTLEEIAQYKAELKQAVRQQEQLLGESFRTFAAPAAGISSVARMAGLFTKGLTVFEGVLFGIRAIRTIRKYFRG